MAARHRGVRLYGALVLMAVLSAVVYWIVGFLPWVLGGFALPAAQARGAGVGLAGVRIAVPMVVPLLPQLAASALLGGVLAGMVPIAFPRVPRALAVVLTGCVVLAETTVLLVAGRATLEGQAAVQPGGDPRVIQGLVLAAVCASMLGLAVGLAATGWHGLVAVAGGLVAAALPPWLAALPGIGPGPVTELLAGAALLVGLVLSVHRSRLSALLWPLAFGVAWLGVPAVAAARTVAAGLAPGSAADLVGLVHAAARVLAERVGPTGQAWWPWLLVAVLALAWLLRAPAGARRRKQERRQEQQQGTQQQDRPAAPLPAPAGEPSRPGRALAPDRGKHAATRRS